MVQLGLASPRWLHGAESTGVIVWGLDSFERPRDRLIQNACT